MPRKSDSAFKGLFLLLVLSAAPFTGFAAEPRPRIPGAFQILSEKAAKLEEVSQTEGWSYIVSGGLALLVSTPAYYLTEDTFGRAIYSLGQTLGIGAIGYGSYLVLMKNDYFVFHQIVSSTKEISPAARDELAYRFLQANAHKARSVRKIRTITHGLTAALNFSSAITSGNKELSTALYFVGSINVFAAVNFAFRKSEEEKLLGQFEGKRTQASFEVSPIIGPITGVQIRF